MSTVIYGEPRSGYTVSGPHDDGTFRVTRREDDGSHTFIGTADDYETARDLAISD